MCVCNILIYVCMYINTSLSIKYHDKKMTIFFFQLKSILLIIHILKLSLLSNIFFICVSTVHSVILIKNTCAKKNFEMFLYFKHDQINCWCHYKINETILVAEEAYPQAYKFCQSQRNAHCITTKFYFYLRNFYAAQKYSVVAL